MALGTTLAIGTTSTALHQNITSGRDFCGENPQAQGAHARTEQAREVVEQKRPAVAELAGTLSGLSAVSVDAATAELARHPAARLSLSSDHPTTLTLTRLRPGSRLHLGGSTAVAGDAGTATLRLPRGASTIRLLNARPA